MNKTQITFNQEEEFTNISFRKQIIQIKKFLSVADVIKLATSYINEYFNKERGADTNVIMAEYSMRGMLFDLVTDKEIEEGQVEIANSTNLFDLVIAEVANYDFLLSVIEKIIDSIEKENSFERKLSILADKVIEFVDNMAKNGFDKEMIAKIGETVKEIQDLNLNKQ